jgi:Fe-S-cluster-containing dehydrogenase component
MSYIIGKSCEGCIDGGCVKVCPVDCIHGPILMDDSAKNIGNLTEEDKIGKQLYINPIDCIKCGACVAECPVDAIYRTEAEAIALNDEISVHKNYEFFGLKFN